MSVIAIKMSREFNTPKKQFIQPFSDSLPNIHDGDNRLKRHYKIMCSEDHIGYSTDPECIKYRYGLCDSCQYTKK